MLRYTSVTSLVYDLSSSSNSNVYLLICYKLLMFMGISVYLAGQYYQE